MVCPKGSCSPIFGLWLKTQWSSDPDGNPRIPVLNSFTIGPKRAIPVMIRFTGMQVLPFMPSR